MGLIRILERASFGALFLVLLTGAGGCAGKSGAASGPAGADAAAVQTAQAVGPAKTGEAASSAATLGAGSAASGEAASPSASSTPAPVAAGNVPGAATAAATPPNAPGEGTTATAPGASAESATSSDSSETGEAAAYKPSVAPGGLVDGEGAPVSLENFVERARQADYVLVGEEHGNPCNHRMQAELLAVLAQSGTPPVLGMEQVSVDRQAVLDRYAAHSLGLEELPGALNWAETWGHDFNAYAPLFITARHFDLPIAALNAPRDVVRKVSRGGLKSLAPDERAMLPAQIVMPMPEQERELREFFGSHSRIIHPEGSADGAASKSGKRDGLASFLLVQSLWDSMMAKEAMAAHERFGRPVLVAAGGGHVEAGWGIAHRLRTYQPGARVLVVMPWRGLEPPEREDADIFYYCPASSHPPQAGRLGVRLEPVAEGLRVEEVMSGSRAERAGLAAGDVIVAAGDAAVNSASALREAALAALREGKALSLEFLRDGQRQRVDVPMRAPGQTESER